MKYLIKWSLFSIIFVLVILVGTVWFLWSFNIEHISQPGSWLEQKTRWLRLIDK